MVEKKPRKDEKLKFPEIIRRSACVFEVIVRNGEDVHAYVLLLKKKNPQHSWWEVPGGEIERDEAPHTRGLIEMVEEAGIHIEPSELITDLTQDIAGRRDSTLVVDAGEKRIINTPFLARRELSALPEINFFAQDPEHEDYRWLEVTGLYKTPRQDYIPFLSEMDKEETNFFQRMDNPKIISMNKLGSNKVETIKLSEVTSNLLKRYSDYIMMSSGWTNIRGLEATPLKQAPKTQI